MQGNEARHLRATSRIRRSHAGASELHGICNACPPALALRTTHLSWPYHGNTFHASVYRGKGAAQAVYIAMEDPHTYLLLRALQSLVHRFRVSVAFKARLALHV